MRIKATILIVDDEAYVRDSLASILRRRGYAVRTATGPQEALRREAVEGLDAVITDLRMPGQNSLDLLKRLVEQDSGLPVIVLTGFGSVPSAVECIRAGAYDYLLKPAHPETLLLVLERALEQRTMHRELEYLRGRGQREISRRGPLGVSSAWKHVLELVDAASATDTTVLLIGETGTGKGEVAQLLHQKSARARGPFVRVHCAAIPFDLFESEFFGHRKGAFTGAVADREGRFRVAHGGTLFMDEIASLPEPAQAKALRVLEDGVFERVGDSHPTAVDVRLIVASNIDLEREVEAHRFRRDLFYRINVMTISVPPLRERRQDIPLLAQAFLEEFAKRFWKLVSSFHSETLAALEVYGWPGNVRELRNVMERAVLLEKSEVLQPSSLPFNLRQAKPRPPDSELDLRQALAGEEKRLLQEALARAGGVKRTAAQLLGIDRRNLAYFLRKHGLASKRKTP